MAAWLAGGAVAHPAATPEPVGSGREK
jgi:hypothetical protein